MDIDLSDEQRFLQQTVRKFLENSAPLSALRDSATAGSSPLTTDYWRQAAGLGLTAMLVPEEFGGIGTEQPVLDLVIAAEELGRQLAPGPLLPVSVVADALARSGTQEQKQQYLPALADGSLLAAWAMAEATDLWEAGGGRHHGPARRH